MADTLDRIWGIGPVNDFIIALAAHVEEKCGYGEELDALSGPERVFYTAQRCEAELDACTDAFLSYEDDLSALNRAYVLNHRARFT